MADEAMQDLAALEAKLGYSFKDQGLLQQALTTPACKMSDARVVDNQRREFLGDAVLGLLVGEALYRAHPQAHEGDLTQRRMRLVSGAALAEVGERMGLRDYLRRNVGASPLPPKAKVLADAVEALMGAAWLDGGLAAARRLLAGLALPADARFDAERENPKGALQMLAQARRHGAAPIYTVVHQEGPDHAPVVTVRVEARGLGCAEATANSKANAEVAAAAALLDQLHSVSGDLGK